MNILLINHYAGSPVHGMEYRPYYMAREWSKIGHDVMIVAASISHLRSQNPKVKTALTEQQIDGIRYLWLKTPEYRGNGIGRVFNMLTFVSRLAAIRNKLVHEFKPDVVIASSTYLLDIYPARLIAKNANAKLIFEVHDLWPLSPIELGGMSRWHPFIIAMQWAENYAYHQAERVVSILPKASDYMVAHGMAPEKFCYIPNGIDVEEWAYNAEPLPELHSAILSRLKEEGRFVIGYAGALGIANALDSLVDAASFLHDSSASILIVGQGQEKERLENKARVAGEQQIVFLPPVKKASIPTLLQMMDGLYIGLQRQPLFRFGVSPNKLMDYMMAGKPVIHAIEAGNDMVAESGCGISIPPEDPCAIAEAIVKLMSMKPEERTAMGLKGREYVLKHHDYRVLARRFLDIIDMPITR